MKKIENGLVIVFEGSEGTGKSTITKEITRWLKEDMNYDTVSFREPGSTELGEKLRNIILYDDNIDPLTETLLFYAARNVNIHNNILPALADNKIVILDRFSATTFVYQGLIKEVDTDFISALDNFTGADTLPDIEFILTCSPETAMDRANAKGHERNKYDIVSKARYESYINNYNKYARELSVHDTKVINTDKSIDKVLSEIKDKIIELIKVVEGYEEDYKVN